MLILIEEIKTLHKLLAPLVHVFCGHPHSYHNRSYSSKLGDTPAQSHILTENVHTGTTFCLVIIYDEMRPHSPSGKQCRGVEKETSSL